MVAMICQLSVNIIDVAIIAVKNIDCPYDKQNYEKLKHNL